MTRCILCVCVFFVGGHVVADDAKTPSQSNDGADQPAAEKPSADKGTPASEKVPAEEDYEALLEKSMTELRLKTEVHKAWGFGSFEQWSFDQESGKLVWSNADGTMATAPAQIVGTFSANDDTWLWAWANRSIDESLTQHARQVREYGKKHNISRLTDRKWKGEEADGWQMAALVMKLNAAQGAYRVEAGKTVVFFTFGKPTVKKQPVVEESQDAASEADDVKDE